MVFTVENLDGGKLLISPTIDKHKFVVVSTIEWDKAWRLMSDLVEDASIPLENIAAGFLYRTNQG